MNTLEALLTRRSIRKYTDENISNDKILKLVEAGMFAPTAFNLEPWHFIIIDDKLKLNELLKVLPHAEMLHQANASILVCGDKKVQEMEGLLVQDCSAVTQNILLAAHEHDLGACWIGIYPFKEFIDNTKNFFNLPPNIIPVSMVALGYPDEKIEQPERFKKQKIHMNKW